MISSYRLDQQLEELSQGRLVYDLRRRRLVDRGSDGRGHHELDITETALRGLLQRLLLNTPQPRSDEPLADAVRLLLAHLDDRL